MKFCVQSPLETMEMDLAEGSTDNQQRQAMLCLVGFQNCLLQQASVTLLTFRIPFSMYLPLNYRF